LPPVFGLFLALLMVILMAGVAGHVHAGVLSFISSFFSGEADNWSFYNSQNLPLLNAPNNPGVRFSASGGAVINVVNDSSLLPVVGPLGSIADLEDYQTGQIYTYTVREGDTLSKIAKMFGVTPSTIYWANNLKNGNVVKPGETLVILPVSGIQYTVKKGDTAASVAKKFKSDEEEFILFNNLISGGDLEEGLVLIIPDAEAAIPGAAAGATAGFRGGSGPEISGYYARPIYGGRRSQGLHGYNGIDLAGSCGTPVFSSAGGTVIISRSQGWNGGYGRYVVITHPNGTQTVYAHLSLVNVGVGQLVSQGFQVGSIGSSGNSTGCHLHFEVRGAKNPF